jgi:cytochrome b
MTFMDANGVKPVKTWDLTIRIWHWSIVSLVVFLWYSAEIADDLMEWHFRAGRLCLTLLVFRFIWGFLGSDTTKFSHFLSSPKHAFRELKTLFSKQKLTPQIGHNAAGGWAVMLILAALFTQTITGLFSTDGYFYEGPWSYFVSSDTAELATDIHELGVNILMGILGVHVAIVIIHGLRGDRLIGAMFTGKKKIPSASPTPENLRWQAPHWALLILLTCWLAVFAATG